jgi:TetR/AcrR family transcriptional repressor of nem operon
MTQSKRERTKQRMLEAAGRGFRTGGFAGVGVDGLAKAAGLTSGAFYSHFSNKARAFREVLVEGLTTLHDAIEDHQRTHGGAWADRFAEFYLRDRLAVDLDDSCALATLTSDAARADDETRAAYQTALQSIASSVAQGLAANPRPADLDRAWTLLALCAGGASMARAVKDPDKAREIAAAVEAAVKAVAQTPKEPD